MTDSLGQSQVLPYLIGLSKLGHAFHILSFEKEEAFNRRGELIEKICQDAGIKWLPKLYTKNPPILSTLKDVVVMRNAAIQLHRKTRFDIVHCRSYIAALIGQVLQKMGVSFLFDMRGFWVDERIDGRLWNKSRLIDSLLYSYFKRKEKDFLLQADQIVSLTHAGKRIIMQWFDEWNVDSENIEVIPCCTDLSLFDYNAVAEDEIFELRSRLNLDGKKVLVYLGSIGTWYMLEEMMDFYKEFRSEVIGSCSFLFISRHSPEEIKALAAVRGIPEEEIVVIPADRENVPSLLLLGDYGVFFIRPLFSKNASSPVKHGEMLGMGIPIVSNSGVGDLEYYTSDSTGVTIHAFTKEEYRRASRQLLESSFSRADLRSLAQRAYSLEAGVETYHELYNKIRN